MTKCQGVCAECGGPVHEPRVIKTDKLFRHCSLCGAQYWGSPIHFGRNDWCPNPAEQVTNSLTSFVESGRVATP